MIYVENASGQPVVIGYAGENKAEVLQIDYSEWIEAYGEGTIALRYQRPHESYPYEIALETDEGVAEWTIDSTATAVRGIGKAQLHYTVDGVLKKSCVFPVVVNSSLTDAGSVPDPYEDWLVTLQEIADQGTASAEAAGEAETAAERAAESASGAAQSASESAQNASRSEETSAEHAREAGVSAQNAERWASELSDAILHFHDSDGTGDIVITSGGT